MIIYKDSYHDGIMVAKLLKRKLWTQPGRIFLILPCRWLTLFDGNIDQALQLSLRNAAAKVAHIGQNSLIKI